MRKTWERTESHVDSWIYSRQQGTSPSTYPRAWGVFDEYVLYGLSMCGVSPHGSWVCVDAASFSSIRPGDQRTYLNLLAEVKIEVIVPGFQEIKSITLVPRTPKGN